MKLIAQLIEIITFFSYSSWVSVAKQPRQGVMLVITKKYASIFGIFGWKKPTKSLRTYRIVGKHKYYTPTTELHMSELTWNTSTCLRKRNNIKLTDINIKKILIPVPLKM